MINPHIQSVYTYCYIRKAKTGIQVNIVATVDGINPEVDTTLVNWLGNYDDLESFLYLTFRNPIIKDERT